LELTIFGSLRFGLASILAFHRSYLPKHQSNELKRILAKLQYPPTYTTKPHPTGLELMPSWTIPTVPGFEHPLDVLNNDHLLQGANGGNYIHNSTISNTNITVNNNFSNPTTHRNVAEDKPDAIPEERRFHLSLGLADPRLQQGSQHLGFGSLGADSGALCKQDECSELCRD
jgi:hypothetical protein